MTREESRFTNDISILEDVLANVLDDFNLIDKNNFEDISDCHYDLLKQKANDLFMCLVNAQLEADYIKDDNELNK